jgi:serine/threonine protein kinase
VSLLDIEWDVSLESGSFFPALVLEYAEFGSMHHLQTTTTPLPFAIKQKLCYDVGRGISILHACGVIHGDLKPQNVLIFRNRYNTLPNQPYTAKLADFGGAVMDFTTQDHQRLLMETVGFESPEREDLLCLEGIKKTDVYSFGILVWSCIIDCKDILSSISFTTTEGKLSQEELQRLMSIKTSDSMLSKAVESVALYRSGHHRLTTEAMRLVLFVLKFTVRADPNDRDLNRAQALLRGMQWEAMDDHFQEMDRKNSAAILWNEPPGKHGASVDGISFYILGPGGYEYDA